MDWKPFNAAKLPSFSAKGLFVLYRPCNARGKNLNIDLLLSLEEKRSVINGKVLLPERMLRFLRVSGSKWTWACAKPNNTKDDMRRRRKCKIVNLKKRLCKKCVYTALLHYHFKIKLFKNYYNKSRIVAIVKQNN